jgi:transcriptional regulator with XRE-family HTH domain
MTTNRESYGSRLGCLMKGFGIAGRELAKVMHVDESLISMLRSGKRKFKPSSKHLDTIVQFFLSLDKHMHYQKIRRMVAEDFPEAACAPAEELTLFLKEWLLQDSKAGDSHYHDIFQHATIGGLADTTGMYHFKGREGRRHAMRLFNDYHAEFPDKVECFIFTTEDGDWFYEDESFMIESRRRNLLAVASGNIITVIHPVNRNYLQLAESIINWLPIHLTGKSVDYFIPDYSDDPIRYTYLLVPGHIVLLGMSSKNYTRSPNTWVTNDPDMVKTVTELLRENINRSKPLFKRFYVESGKQYRNLVFDIMQRMNAKYYFGPTLQYVPLDEDFLTKILRENGISEERIEEYATRYNRLCGINMSIGSRYIVDTRSLEILLQQETVEWNYMSLLFGERIVIDQTTYRKVIHELFAKMRTLDAVEAAIWENDRENGLRDINVLAQENVAVQFIGTRVEKPIALILQESTFVVSFMEKLKTIWAEIPAIRKNKEHVYNTVEKMLLSQQQGTGSGT